MSETLLIDGFGPLPVRRPGSAAEVGELVRAARAKGEAVYPVGGRTTLDLGNVPTMPGIALDLTGLNAVVEHASRDMTVTVQAGITLTALADVLAAERQWLPIDVPHPDRATVGGAVAANRSGPRRLGQGTVRDYLIGLSFISDDGAEVKGGGRVVKNVAGYDLMKLHTGALGTLGVLTQLTFKVKPIPEASAVVAFGVGVAALGPTLDRLHASASRPVSVEVERAGGDGWRVVCGYEEKAVTVAWQIETLTKELAAAPVRGLTVERDGDEVARLTALQAGGAGTFTLKVNTTPGNTAVVLLAAAALHSDAAVHAHAANGIVWVHLPTEIGVGRAAGAMAELTKLTTANGNVSVRRCPPAWKAVLPVWGRDRGDRDLMRTITRTLDPDGVFNPGRV